MDNKDVDFIKGAVLYDDGEHKFIWLGEGEEKDEEGEKIAANQYLILDNKEGFLLDPGSIYDFPRVIENASRYIDPSNITAIFYSHQDPDVSSGISMWLNETPAVVYVSKLWTRFLPHFGYFNFERIIPIPDQGAFINFGNSQIEFIPAHFLHSVAHFNVFDKKSRILFTGDIGVAVYPDGRKMLFVENFEEHINFMKAFHERYMCSQAICRKWVSKVLTLKPTMLVPQHGAIFKDVNVLKFLEWFSSLKCGIDLADKIYGF